jgi:hypothetical protein
MASRRVGANYATGTHYAFMVSKKAGALSEVGRGSANIQGFVASASSVHRDHVSKTLNFHDVMARLALQWVQLA